MNKDKSFDKWQELKAENKDTANERLEQWLIDEQIKENMKENPSLYRQEQK